MIALVRQQFRRELQCCTEQRGCPAQLHLSTCAEFRELLRETD